MVRLATLLAALTVIAPAVHAGAAQRPDTPFDGVPVQPSASLPDIEDEVMCPICGVSLELATEAPQAQQEREYIRELIARGLTKQEILDALVAEFGAEVLATPEAEGFDLAAWLVPGAAIVLAAVAIVVGLRRWRNAGRRNDGAVPDADRPVSDADAKRLDDDLARYEL